MALVSYFLAVLLIQGLLLSPAGVVAVEAGSLKYVMLAKGARPSPPPPKYNGIIHQAPMSPPAPAPPSP
ncbi:hypothetical protein CCACVL1_00728 [Corchorus capsularis]|uniref:Uncharacterized protein n=1 Tax=Corchorus capsularis TaxID=210143 RepID=A0A1R3KVB6_COCAP|nr:hypothetical protein CCACVL1_00728 [Corchorus capsularis]